jgi:hypothetical protein
VAVFVDYQNVYKGVRNAFCPGSPNHVDGQISPLALGRRLTVARRLVGVRMYRGMPSQHLDEKGFPAAQRQVAVWEEHPLVRACHRPLNYREVTAPREKGIDVLLAIDFVMMAMKGEFEVAVLFSADTDLIPALEAVIDLKGPQACEVAYWVPPVFSESQQAKPLGVRGRSLQKHALHEADYRTLHDPTDYTIRQRRR